VKSAQKEASLAGRTLEYSTAAAQVAAKASVAPQRLKKARGGGDYKTA
jgi:hypothetical protein